MSASLNYSHSPVLLNEVVSALCNGVAGSFLDCTFGGGGHTLAILSAFDENVVYGIDRDPEAIRRAEHIAEKFTNRFFFFRINFTDISKVQTPPFDGIVMDLGLSSFQLDDSTRGFSFKYHDALDMRMDNSCGQTASEFLNSASEGELIQAIRDFGEERSWRRVVKAIIDNRGTDNLVYGDLLAKLIEKTVFCSRKAKIHPATKTFQGIRIAINAELASLGYALPILFQKLRVGGRLLVISFHSLEDRIVKQFFKKMAGCAVCASDGEPSQYKEKLAKVITTKPIIPTDEEIFSNPRSRSAKMRVLERIK